MKLNLKNVFLSVGIFVFTLALVGALSTNKAYAAICTASVTGLWSAPATWGGACNANTIPVGGDTVIINTAVTVTITSADPASLASLTLNAGTSALTFSTANALVVTGATTLNTGSILTTNGGTFTTGTLSVTGLLNLGTGPSTVSTTTIVNSGGEIRLSGASGLKTFSGIVTISSGGTYNEIVAVTPVTFSGALNNAGTVTVSTGTHTFGAITNTGTFNYAGGVTLTTIGAANVSGTFNYNGVVAQAVQVTGGGFVGYYNLTLSGSGVKTVAALIGATQIVNIFDISGTAQASLTGDSLANAFTVNSSAKAKGTWGSNSSVATHQDNVLFAGTNLITITTGSSSTSTTTTTTDAPPTTTATVADTTPPSGTSVSINDGVSTTSALSSNLTFTAIDATEMLISNDAGFAGASWESYAGSKAWTLTSGDGVKTVYAKFRDAAGNVSIAVIDAITVSGSGTVAVVSNEPVQGCSAGNRYNTSTGALCVSAVAQAAIAGCDNRTTGFSTTIGGKSCVGNIVSAAAQSRTYNFGSVTLKSGSQGNAVMELQRFLNAKLNLGLVIDGKLGPKTIAVIKQWQSDHGLVSDGLVGAKTKAQMHAEE